uniref:Uncharacterized protein n=1 Tax=Timema monikensis TaxID=170555 RepID=A0A7R9ENJ2_9NEOP|nr:unnamed protein product [Timema monikensis]
MIGHKHVEVGKLQAWGTPNREPYVPACKCFFPKMPVEARVKLQLSRLWSPRRVVELENHEPYMLAYTLFFKNHEVYVYDY